MIKKITQFFLLFLILLGLLKIFFFSGKTSSTNSLVSRKAKAGFVWAKASGQYARSKVGTFFLGEHYRSVWAAPVQVPVINLNTMYGGLLLGKVGGGMQTTSLNVKDKTGNAYVLRSLNKDPLGVLPPFWRKTIVADLVRDQIAAANPYAALVVAPLAQAAGIFHTNPRVFLVADTDKMFRNVAEQTGNKLFLFEEKYSQLPAAPHQFGPATALLNSVEMLDNRFRFNAHTIDQALFLRCRLFDILIGDWDRHEGQWNWAAYPTATGILYKPIPKDRDQAFSKYQDGVLPWLLTRSFALPKFGHFRANPQEVVAYTINAAFLDERALNTLTRTDFRNAARELQTVLTDKVIEQAVNQFPPAVYRLVGSETERILKSRRTQLPALAESYYQLLAKHVVIPGSDEKEKFVVTHLPQGQTRVQVFALLEGNATSRLLYERVFSGDDTEEITLHGLGGDDSFIITGPITSSLMVNVVGGSGSDFIQDNTTVAKATGKTIIYDTRKGNTIRWGKNTINKTSSDISVHLYDREGF